MMIKATKDCNYVLRNLSLKYLAKVSYEKYIDFNVPNTANYVGYIVPRLTDVGLLFQYSIALPKHE